MASVTLAERLAEWCSKYKATHSRSVAEDGTVTIRLHLAAGDALSGAGPTTEAAVKALGTKLEAIGHAL